MQQISHIHRTIIHNIFQNRFFNVQHMIQKQTNTVLFDRTIRINATFTEYTFP
ncbi:hypothetical protein Bache_0770 [Bacteroides helcogenes P 36-108]|uniref:Uncharacterized protein n=1 Tax=Bacteroides helcogenes (strain ATCC 35417 / DSM 20613 / JCM 6297 / CCUG 15421 / P 36-108) TaxID=693979 RepID=E6SNX4_BACT6|nr:hypothetical protein Bache_0770 [Bacteroides helcogenes P 36-108]